MEDTKEYSEQVTNIKKVKTEYQYREDGEPGTMQELMLNEQEEKIFTQMQGKIYGYSNLMMMFRCAIREVRTKLEVLDDEFSVRYKRNPITKIQSRVKKPMSVYRKLQKYGLELTEDNILNGLHDVAGVRVICSFIDDIYMIAALMASQDDIKILKVKDYIKNPKPNGYSSYHMIVEIPVFFSKGKTPMKVEIQIRTMAMDFWASLEHQLRYKKNIEEIEGHEEISRRLLACAQTISQTDKEMQEIKRMIGSFNDLS